MPVASSGTALQRAAVYKLFLSGARDLGEDMSAAIERELGARRLAKLEASPGLSWIDHAEFSRLLSAVDHHGGPPATRAVGTTAVVQSLDRGYFRATIRSVLHIVHNPLPALLRGLPRAWDQVSRQAGCVRTQLRTDTEAHVHLETLAPVLRAPAFAECWRGIFEGCLQLVGQDGEVRTDAAELESGTIAYCIEW